MLVRAGPEEAQRLAIARREGLHDARYFHLVDGRRHALQAARLELGRDFIEEIVDAANADRIEHRANVSFGVGNERHVGRLLAGIVGRDLRPEDQLASLSRCFAYASASMSAPMSEARFGRSRINQPAP